MTDEADLKAQRWLMRPRGAYVMGRNMFGPARGPVEMEGGTTFHFVTGGFDAAFEASWTS